MRLGGNDQTQKPTSRVDMRTSPRFGQITLIGQTIVILICAALIAVQAPAQKRKDESLAPILDEENEKLRKLREVRSIESPPFAQAADASRLVFQTAPLSTSGVLSKQVQRALRYLAKQERRGTLVHLRAFVAGSGDTRRVQAVVSEELTRWRKALPALSVVQVGELARSEAYLLLEAVSDSGKELHPGGLAFISGQAVVSGEAVLTVAPLVEQSAEQIETAARELGADPLRDVLRVTCYCSSLEDGREVGRRLRSSFPEAAVSYVQLRRVYTHAAVTCEAITRLPEPRAETLSLENPATLPSVEEHSQVAILPPGPVMFSGTQLGFGRQESDVRLAFERLHKSLEEAGPSRVKVAASRFYLLSSVIGHKIRDLRFEFFDKAHPPASTMVELEGLPSLDASFAMDVVAVPTDR